MKKSLIVFSVVAAALAFGILPLMSHAVIPGDIPENIVGNPGGPTTISGWVDVLLTVVQWVYTLIFILAVLFILIAAFYFITSGGDSEKTGKAKSMLLYAIIGIAVALLSYAIVSLVRNSIASGLTA